MTRPASHKVFHEVLWARDVAHRKHGENSMETAAWDSPLWLAILVEEIGEIANALTYDGPSGNLRKEMIDALSVLFAWVDAIDTKRGKP